MIIVNVPSNGEEKLDLFGGISQLIAQINQFVLVRHPVTFHL
jgi:hypothetical protein